MPCTTLPSIWPSTADRVERAPDILEGGVAQHRHLAGLSVDLDIGDMDADLDTERQLGRHAGLQDGAIGQRRLHDLGETDRGARRVRRCAEHTARVGERLRFGLEQAAGTAGAVRPSPCRSPRRRRRPWSGRDGCRRRHRCSRPTWCHPSRRGHRRSTSSNCSAAICAIVVRVPEMSAEPIVTIGRPSPEIEI